MNKLLLIANYKYKNCNMNLSGIEKEIEKVRDTFETMEYGITEVVNQGYAILKDDVNDFLKDISKSDTAVIYYTGHGCHCDGRNFIVCVDSDCDIQKNIDSSFYEDFYKLYDLNNITEHVYKTKNVLLVCNACRTKETSKLNESLLDKNKCDERNVIAQIYATALYNPAYNTDFFYENFCEASSRYKHSVSDIYEAICCKKNDVNKKYFQNPIYIKCEEEFFLTNTLNEKIERHFFQDIIDIYNDYILNENNDQEIYTISAEELYDKCYEIAKIRGPKNYVIEIMNKYLLSKRKYQFISCMLRMPIYTAFIEEDKFKIHAKMGWHTFDNINLYDFNKCEKALENDSREIYGGIKSLLDHVFFLNFSEYSYNRCMELRIENSEVKEFCTFFNNDIFLRDTDIAFREKKSMLISANNRTDSIGFLRSMVCKCISHEEKILMLRYMEDISSYNEVENISINEILKENELVDTYIRKIIEGRYEWLIISLHASLEVLEIEDNIDKVERLVKVAKENKIPTIIITNVMPDFIKTVKLTKRFYKYIDVEIDLDSSECPGKTYVNNFLDVSAK